MIHPQPRPRLLTESQRKLAHPPDQPPLFHLRNDKRRPDRTPRNTSSSPMKRLRTDQLGITLNGIRLGCFLTSVGVASEVLRREVGGQITVVPVFPYEVKRNARAGSGRSRSASIADIKTVKTQCTGPALTYLGMESKPQQGTIHDPVEQAKKSYLPQGEAVRGRSRGRWRRAENKNRNR